MGLSGLTATSTTNQYLQAQPLLYTAILSENQPSQKPGLCFPYEVQEVEGFCSISVAVIEEQKTDRMQLRGRKGLF